WALSSAPLLILVSSMIRPPPKNRLLPTARRAGIRRRRRKLAGLVAEPQVQHRQAWGSSRGAEGSKLGCLVIALDVVGQAVTLARAGVAAVGRAGRRNAG